MQQGPKKDPHDSQKHLQDMKPRAKDPVRESTRTANIWEHVHYMHFLVIMRRLVEGLVALKGHGTLRSVLWV